MPVKKVEHIMALVMSTAQVVAMVSVYSFSIAMLPFIIYIESSTDW